MQPRTPAVPQPTAVQLAQQYRQAVAQLTTGQFAEQYQLTTHLWQLAVRSPSQLVAVQLAE
eukprot:8890985-Alexandrium_andersonii.AAC.1